MAALARQGEMAFLFVEVRAEANELGDLARRFAHDHFNDVAMAQPAAGAERILDVILKAILRRQHPRDAALGVVARTLLNLVLGDDEHVERRRDFERRAQARNAGADDEDVGEDVRRPLGIELHEVAVRRRH
jgi:hypothetical protein